MKEQVFNAVSGRSAFYIRLFGTLLAIVLLVYLLSQQGWEQIKVAIQQIPVWRLLVAMGLMFISRIAVAGRWHVLLHSADPKVSPWDTLRVTFAGLFASNFLPTTVGGDVIRLAGAIQLKIDTAISAASLIVDRLVGMAGMAMMVPFGLPSFLAARDSTNNSFLYYKYLLGGILPASMMKWATPLWNKVMKLFRRVIAALSIWKKRPQSLLQSLAFTWANMLGLFSVLYVLFQGMGEDLPIWLIGGLYSIVYLITLLPFSINGYGIQEVSMTFIFSSIGGVSVSSALTAALLFRTLMMIASLPGAAFVPGLLAGARSQPGSEK
jgi:uncharacterized membrane protein YbhN (UPF0104 family)